MKYGYREVRKLSRAALGALCINENFYTNGTNEEYENLLKMSDKENITTDDIVEIATDIIEHSDSAVEKIKKIAGYDIKEVYTHIMYLIAKKCYTKFEEA